jgi:xylan 1,4-beta-xylosidase
MNRNDFNAFHSPIGAHASFTLGCHGSQGGLGLELGGPAGDQVFIGVSNAKGDGCDMFPFGHTQNSESLRYADNSNKKIALSFNQFKAEEITREFDLGVDRWQAGGLDFAVYSPVEAVPEPKKSNRADCMRVLRPSVTAELSFDNRKGKTDRRMFFGYAPAKGTDAVRRILDEKGMTGVGQGSSTAIFTDHPQAKVSTNFHLAVALEEPYEFNHGFALGNTGILMVDIPAGKKVTLNLALCFFRQGTVTTGLETSYLYTRWFKNIEAVGKYTLANFKEIRKAAKDCQALVKSKKLNEDQRFQLIHAIRSYYGSTQFLDHDGEPLWVVNEGEYRMLNTFDLTVDQLFYEMKLNPWTVRNVLDLFVDRYSYTDKVHAPGGKNIYPGGISFAHDMGQRNHFSPAGRSSYELTGLTGCFSHMTHEQLVNWVLCAAVYVQQTEDHKWLKKQLPVFKKCLRSLLNRDAPTDSERNGIMGMDSSRTELGAEITTYDSLDESLGQARNNGYMAVKIWAAYLALEQIFTPEGLAKEAATCLKQAARAADTIVSHVIDGELPALLGEETKSRIIPTVEGLVFPKVLGLDAALSDSGPYGHLIGALRTHTENVLKKGVCLYDDGAWKLSSTADNSWLSKIYLCQYVVREILGIKNPVTGETADRAHVGWLLNEKNLRWAWSDQMRSGVAHGSLYYPRGVTAILWLTEK